MLQKLKVTSYAFIYFLLFGFSFIALQVTTEEVEAANPDMVCNVHEYTIKQCGNPASINDPCPILGMQRLYDAVRMCYSAGDAYHCAVDWAGGSLGECTWGPPTPQWLEFKDMDDRGHQRGAYAPHNPDPMNCEEVRIPGQRRPEYLCKDKNRDFERGIMGDMEDDPRTNKKRMVEEENEAGVTKAGKCFEMRGSQRNYGSQYCKGAEIQDNRVEQ